jgi:ActR/RegA family two-component response regulator
MDGKRKINPKLFLAKLERLKAKRSKSEIALDKHISEVLNLLPNGLTLNKLKFSYVDKIIAEHHGNLSAAARVLDVPYRTMVSWVHDYHRVAQKLDELRANK